MTTQTTTDDLCWPSMSSCDHADRLQSRLDDYVAYQADTDTQDSLHPKKSLYGRRRFHPSQLGTASLSVSVIGDELLLYRTAADRICSGCEISDCTSYMPPQCAWRMRGTFGHVLSNDTT